MSGYNEELTEYFESTQLISDDERDAVRDQCLSSIKFMNAYEGFNQVLNAVLDAGVGIAIFSAWALSAAVSSIFLCTTTPKVIAISYCLGAILFLVGQFALYLRDPNPKRWPRHLRWLGLSLFVGFVAVLIVWSSQGLFATIGSALIAFVGACVATLASLVILDIRNVKASAALYLLAIGFIALGACRGLPGWPPWPHWPNWVVLGLWSALWAALSAVVLTGLWYVLVILTGSLLQRWKVRHHAVDELIQSLALLGLQLDELGKPEQERSTLSQAYPINDRADILSAVEYLAMMLQSVGRHLPTGNRASDALIAERCHGMAAAVRELKVRYALDRSIEPDEIASDLVPAVVPISLGHWSRIQYLDPQVQPPRQPRWKRMLRVLGGLAAAVGPLAALVILNSTTSWVSGRVYDQALPIVITWLVVSVIAWLDPGASGRLSGAKGVSDAVSGAIRAAGKTG